MLFFNTLLTASAVVPTATQQPNIIVFLIDDMGVMDTSVPFIADKNGKPQSYPLNEWYRTPNMEKMAKQGVRFSTFYAQSVSSPSRASLMTGKNAAHHRTTNWIDPNANNRTTFGPPEWNWNGLNPEDDLLPKLLKQAGYKTIHIGKAHFGPKGSASEDPSNIGFDINIGGCGIGHPGSYYGEDGYGNLKGQKSHAVPHLEKYHGSDTFLTEALTLEANEQISAAVKEDRPFFLYLSHYAVHSPFQVDKRYIDHYRNSDKGEQAEAYAALIEGMDKSLGDLMAHLQKEGIAENTLVVFLGDNGGDAPLGDPNGHFSAAPLRGKKGSFYEGGVRVPFIMSWAQPASNKIQKDFPIASNAIYTQPAKIMDVYPTLLDLANVRYDREQIDGVSLTREMKGQKNKSRSNKILTHFPHGQHRGNYFTAFRDGDWKLIYHYNPENPDKPGYELYDLRNDPFEKLDLSSVYPKRLLNMTKSMIRELNKENALYPIDKNGNILEPILPTL